MRDACGCRRRSADLVETFGFSWVELEQRLKEVGPRDAYARFLQVIADNRNKPAWWVESRASDEAGRIEKTLARGLWVLETIVTAAPLLGLLGTITGMMQSFNVIGASTLVAPTQVTAGVAQALIATALGLADRGARAVCVQPVLADAIAGTRHDGAAGIAAGRSYTARPGRRRGGADCASGGCRAMKIQRARHFRHGRIEIIPMIDVMFFLLVTFMLASLSMQTLNSIAVNLPKGNAESMEHQEPITLTVTHDSKIFVDKTPTTLEQLAFVLKPLLKTNDLGVVVNADTDAPEGAVVEAMIEARRAGVEKFLIAVKH